MKLATEQIEKIVKGAPVDDWTHYCTRNRQYFKRDGNTDRLFVWLSHTEAWSVPLSNKPRWLERRERLEEILTLRKRVEELEYKLAEAKSLQSYNHHIAKLKTENQELSAMVEQLHAALRHLHHNAKASGAEMGLALDVAEDALKSTPQQSLAEHDVEVLLKLADYMESGFGIPVTMGCDEVREYALRIKGDA